LKAVIDMEVIVFLAFGVLSISCYTPWYSGTDYVVTFCKDVRNCRVPYKAPASVPGVQDQTIYSIREQENIVKLYRPKDYTVFFQARNNSRG